MCVLPFSKLTQLAFDRRISLRRTSHRHCRSTLAIQFYQFSMYLDTPFTRKNGLLTP